MTAAVAIVSLWALSNIIIIRFFQKLSEPKESDFEHIPSGRSPS